MGSNIPKEVGAMKRMTTRQLKDRYEEVFGEACRSNHKQWLIKRIAYARNRQRYESYVHWAMRSEQFVEALSIQCALVTEGLVYLGRLLDRLKELGARLDDLESRHESEEPSDDWWIAGRSEERGDHRSVFGGRGSLSHSEVTTYNAWEMIHAEYEFYLDRAFHNVPTHYWFYLGELLQEGELQPVLGWLRALPREFVDENPRLPPILDVDAHGNGQKDLYKLLPNCPSEKEFFRCLFQAIAASCFNESLANHLGWRSFTIPCPK